MRDKPKARVAETDSLIAAACSERTRWWREARFGIFIHWGVYAVAGRGECVMYNERIPPAEYDRLIPLFRPARGFARQWARLARDAGARYLVLTTKHGDGFCLFDTKDTERNSVRAPIHRDLVAEYVDACRAEGLRVGFYYAVSEWSNPDCAQLSSEDPYTRLIRAGREPKPQVFYEHVRRQVRELLTQYGPIDILWFDGTHRAFDGRPLMAEVRRLQPQIIMNTRAVPNRDEGDYIAPEQWLPRSPIRHKGVPVLWELCQTLTCGNWGYDRYDHDYLPVEHLAGLLERTGRLGGNFLLNIGPKADGSVPAPARSILRGLGRWIRRNEARVFNVSVELTPPAPAPAPRPAGGVDYVIRHGVPAPINGSVDPALWRKCDVLRLSNKTHWDYSRERYPVASQRGRCTSTLRMMHAQSVLYFAAEIESEHPVTRDNVYMGDSVELFIGAGDKAQTLDYTRSCFQVVIDCDGKLLLPWEERMPGLVFRHAVLRTPTGYNVVLAMPFATLLKDPADPASAVRPGDRISMNVVVNQATPTELDLNPSRPSAKRPWWLRPPDPARQFVGARHRVYWKGTTREEKPETTRAVWAQVLIEGE